MVSYTVLALIVVGSLISVGTLVAGIVWVGRMVRALSPGTHSHNYAEPQGPAPFDIDNTALRVLSERLQVLEGRLSPMQQVLDGYGAISTRLSALEARVPSVIDAMDKMQQTTLNADKRASERERRAKKKDGDDGDGQTVEQAAATMGMAANPDAAIPVPAANGRRPGVLGKGG